MLSFVQDEGLAVVVLVGVCPSCSKKACSNYLSHLIPRPRHDFFRVVPLAMATAGPAPCGATTLVLAIAGYQRCIMEESGRPVWKVSQLKCEDGKYNDTYGHGWAAKAW